MQQRAQYIGTNKQNQYFEFHQISNVWDVVQSVVQLYIYYCCRMFVDSPENIQCLVFTENISNSVHVSDDVEAASAGSIT